MEHWTEHSRFALSLFAIIAPMAAIPIFIGLTTHMTSRERFKAASAAALTLIVVLIGGYAAGEPLINALGTSIESFQIAGGFVIGLSGFAMMNAPAEAAASDGSDGESAILVGIVPVGMPLLAGPGALTTVMLEGHRGFSPLHDGKILSVIVGCGVLTWLLLVFAQTVARRVGRTGLVAFQRFFGLIVIAVGVEIIIRGVFAHVDRFINMTS